MDEKQLQKLIRKNSENAEKARKRPPAKNYDPTLTRDEAKDEDLERSDFFDQMKKREF